MNVSVLPIADLRADDVAAWSALQRADVQLHNPFFRPEFAQAAGQSNGRTEVAVFREAGEAVGFFPFERQRPGIGCPVGSLIADMQGIIGKPGLQCDAAELLRQCGLVTWTFDHLLASQFCFQPFHQCLDDSNYMDLRAGFEAYCEERRQANSQIIRNLERRKRQLGREVGPLRFEWHTDDHAVFTALCRWKQDQLRQMHYADVFQLQHFLDLLHRIGKQRSESFRGVISALYAGDQLIAAQFGAQSHEVLSVSIPVYNPTYSKYSAGSVLHLELARHAPDHGVTCIELGRGDNQTKRSFRSGAVPLALGAIDLRPLPALFRKAWYGMRNVVHSTPLGTTPLCWYRRIRNRLVSLRTVNKPLESI